MAGAAAAGKSNGQTPKLGTVAFAALIFFSVSGGPFGTEDAIKAVGALPTILGIMIFPILWAIPESMVTAELATAFPEDSGYVAWVTQAFGPFWGWLEGWLSLVANTASNAAYPAIVADYVALWWPVLNGGWERVVFILFCVILFTYINYMGLKVVGWGEVVNGVFVMAPFVVLFFYCLPRIQPELWLQSAKNPDWETYMNVLLWNLNYWSYAATLAGEVEDPARTFPRALSWAILFVVLSYLFPIVSCLGVGISTDSWRIGFFGEAAKQLAGPWLMIWVIVSAVASMLGLYEASLASAAYLILGMGERGFLPKFCTHRSVYGTPTVGVWWQVLPVFILANFNFSSLLGVINSVFSFSILIGFAAMVWLRIKHPDLPRPYRMPMNTTWVIITLVPGSLFLVWIMAIPFYKLQWSVLALITGTTITGLALWPLLSSDWLRSVCAFNPLCLDFQRVVHIEAPGGEGSSCHEPLIGTGMDEEIISESSLESMPVTINGSSVEAGLLADTFTGSPM